MPTDRTEVARPKLNWSTKQEIFQLLDRFDFTLKTRKVGERRFRREYNEHAYRFAVAVAKAALRLSHDQQ